MKKKSRPFLVWLLVFMLVFLGIGALGGGGSLILKPDGSILQMPVEWLAVTPFSSYLIPGLILFTLVGVYPMVVAYCLQSARLALADALNPFKSIHWAWAASLAAGTIAMIWIAVQVWMLGYVHPLQPTIFITGTVIVLLTLVPSVRRSYTNPA
jgi:hypothetical protein